MAATRIRPIDDCILLSSLAFTKLSRCGYPSWRNPMNLHTSRFCMLWNATLQRAAWMRKRLHPVQELTGGMGFLEARDQIGQSAVVDAAAVLSGGDRQTDREVGLTDARWTEEDHVLLPFDETESRERFDMLALERGLKGEVKIGQRLHRRKATAPHRRLKSAVIPKADLSAEHGGDRLGGAQPAVDTGEDVVQSLQLARHLEVGELSTDLVPEALHRAPAAIAA